MFYTNVDVHSHRLNHKGQNMSEFWCYNFKNFILYYSAFVGFSSILKLLLWLPATDITATTHVKKEKLQNHKIKCIYDERNLLINIPTFYASVS